MLLGTQFARVMSSLAAALCLLLPATLVAAPAEKAGGTQLIMLGTNGGPRIRKERAEPSTLLVVDGTAYLIDCGVGALRRIVEAGFAPEDVHTIFITHHHPDHDLDLANIMASDLFSIGDNDGRKAWNIYGPPGTRRFVDAAVNYIGVPFGTFAAQGLAEPNIAGHFIAHDIAEAGDVYQDDKIRVTAIENAHFALMSGAERAHMKSYSYRFQTPHGVIVFTGDTGPSEAVAQFAKGADVLVSEVLSPKWLSKRAVNTATPGTDSRASKMAQHLAHEHLLPDAVAKIAREANAKAVVLYHLVSGNDPADIAEIVDGVKKGYGGQTIASQDLARYCINASDQGGPVITNCP